MKNILILAISILATGCYTQLALNDDAGEESAPSEALPVTQRPPIIIIVEQPYVPVYVPYPHVGNLVPGPTVQPTVRDIGNQRGSAGEVGSRNQGSSRGGR